MGGRAAQALRGAPGQLSRWERRRLASVFVRQKTTRRQDASAPRFLKPRLKTPPRRACLFRCGVVVWAGFQQSHENETPDFPCRRFFRAPTARRRSRRPPSARRGRATAQPRFRNRHAQGLDGHRRRVQQATGQGRPGGRAPRRFQERTSGTVLDRRLRDHAGRRVGHAHLCAVQGHATVGELPRRWRPQRKDSRGNRAQGGLRG